tara:strand:- start:4038 stop:4358 length:321 start_codon:yes stop_codon:yes gene_type:complete
MYVYTVTIGRNVGDIPMRDIAWSTFEDQINALMASYVENGSVVEMHSGTGGWNGVSEDSTKVTLITEHPLTDRKLADLKRGLAYYAAQYTQDAIALTIGQSELITA